ncbi:hypothetical protein DPMN_102940 [Dreissena polymorpha]|uniref:B box-type domain-containing protein n=1 Tax=Dreissena polymorpha TaxID=45954 RepID=A0A9D4HDJ2_DREPO|nr:hypothetical protein DPMN_102940 [Dreissena polymorpha]
MIACDVCDSLLAEIYCYQCKQHMCSICEWYHARLMVSRYHNTVSRKSFNIDEKTVSISNFMTTLALESTISQTGCCCPSTCQASCETRSIFLGAVLCKQGFCFVTRVYEHIKTNEQQKTKYTRKGNDPKGFIVVKCQETEILRCELKKHEFKALLYGNSFSVISDNSSKSIWITAAGVDCRVYELDTNSKKLAISFQTNGTSFCHGIAMFDGGLAISIRSETVYETPEWQVQLFSRQGDLKRQLIGDNEEIVLKTPEHLASNADEDILYISDRAANAVIGINPRGSVLFTFMSTSMFAPRGLSVDLEGHFYVACDQGVIQIHKDGKQFRMILRLKITKQEFKHLP